MEDQEKLEQDINDIKDAVTKLSQSVKKIEDALARNVYIPMHWHSIEFCHKDKQLIFDKRYLIDFDKNEAAILGIMFSQKTSKPKRRRFYCIDVAEDFRKVGNSPRTAKTVHQTISRIDKKVLQMTGLMLFHITTKEFYIVGN